MGDGDTRSAPGARMTALGGELVRYVGVSTVSFATDIAMLVALTERAGLHYLESAAAAFCTGMLVNYGLSVRFVFRHRAVPRRGREVVIFAAIGIVGLGVNQLVMYVVTHFAGAHYAASKLVAGVAVLLFTFTTRRLALFTRSTATRGDVGYDADRVGSRGDTA